MANIRPFNRGDESFMEKIAPRAFGVWTRLALDKTLPEEGTRRYLVKEVKWYIKRCQHRNENLGILVAEEDKEVVGYIVLGIDTMRSNAFGFLWGHIISLAVDPDYHGKGIGSSLIKEGLGWLKDKGVKYAEVLTDQNNIGAIRAYEKNDFRVIYSSIVLSQYL
ncbi:GNAT family N-acetyltransferase [Candidatus Poribacteria bacterium]|nr:GNAT family N-acetyltransferase [Candidatus Poribacteria bacterium]